MGRRLAALAACGTLAFGGWFAACGLDEGGTFDASDGSIGGDVIVDQIVKEVNPEANPPTLSCEEAGTPLDASCLGKPVPAGWQPIAIQVGVAASCGDGGFVPTPLETNPQLPTGACNCTPCGYSGSWTCGASIKGGNTCTTETLDASTSTCFANVSHPTYGVFVTRYGNPQCGGGQQTGFQDASSTLVSTCTPQSCDTDFCALGGQGFKLCIYNANQSDGGCPQDFPASTLVGPSASVACDNCQQCALANADAGCTGVAIAYSNNNCNGNVLGTSTAGTCGDLGGTSTSSIYYDAGPVPQPSCGSPTGVTGGKATLDQPSTICCGN